MCSLHQKHTLLDLYRGLPLAVPNLKQEISDGVRARVAALRPEGPISSRFLANNLTIVVGDSVFVRGWLLPNHVDYGLDRINEEHLSRQVLQPRIAKLDHIAVSHQGTKINSGGHRKPIILSQLVDISVNTHIYKSVDRVVMEVAEGLGDLEGVDELEDEASVADVELESGGKVIMETVVRSPLNVEADDEAVENGTMDSYDFKNPRVNEERRASDKGVDLIDEEGYVVGVVG
ncbi:Shewanella-like protein phosphatase 2 [Camellia lanceoleosa]|uniref:Shewanella-like protein phosphatase 2 n=1 Tax=Camellia lanceoleosa TaxID=1840588 RepID=A0ACC0J5A1_9ERIC|nr:Shewanella-like protein phosphatase 2 [Camellia lanceoleosa]